MFCNFSLGPACWLWDYLRRSKQVRVAGFVLCLGLHISCCATGMYMLLSCATQCKVMLFCILKSAGFEFFTGSLF